jgi:hypothetical protein
VASPASSYIGSPLGYRFASIAMENVPSPVSLAYPKMSLEPSESEGESSKSGQSASGKTFQCCEARFRLQLLQLQWHFQSI